MERKDGEFFMTLMSCGCRVKGLPTKKKYRFRVLAENLAGPGKPSAETDPVLIKDPIGMLKTNKTMFFTFLRTVTS